MYHEEKTFTFRFSLEAAFPDDYEGDQDDYAWLRDWETRVKPEVIKIVFDSLRHYPTWNVHVRNRGKSTTDEIEIAVARDFSQQEPYSI